MPDDRPLARGTGNRLLDALGPAERARLAEQVVEVSLRPGEQLYPDNNHIDYAYFPLRSLVSIRARRGGAGGVETATIGNDGMVGLSLSWGANALGPAEMAEVQVPGPALRMEASVFSSELARAGALTSVVRRYTEAFVSQLSQRVACNALHSVPQRCARWLLSAHDRVGPGEFPLTHERLAQVLGVRRASVSAVARALQLGGLVRYGQGRLEVTDGQGLEHACCSCYQAVREVFERLLL